MGNFAATLVGSAICLHAPYELSGTGLAYGGTSVLLSRALYALLGRVHQRLGYGSSSREYWILDRSTGVDIAALRSRGCCMARVGRR
eukprot:85566-Rhodomonas_salina.2